MSAQRSLISPAVMKKIRKSPLYRAGVRGRELFSRNVLLSVVFFLIGNWLCVSAIVYHFEKNSPHANITTYTESLWWGIVTFLTVGYGDRYPVTGIGRIAAVFLMMAGVVSVGTLTARVSSYFLERALREGRGLMDTTRLKDHFIVCGWKDEMHQILTHILDFNPTLEPENLVLIANIGQHAMDEIRAVPQLRKVNIIVGDYFTETCLKRCAPESARKIMILADRSPSASGQIPSPTEVDARTIMTAMTLSTLARGTLVAAEVLDPRMDQYLKLASVSEIIYSREHNRLLIANASGGTGVANIIFDLLNPESSAFITTLDLPDGFHDRPYSDLRTHFATHGTAVLIGVLENSGNRTSIKELALKRAQKTTDVGQLLMNLKTVKELKCNHPVFHPKDDYLVNEGSMAIVIEHRILASMQSRRDAAREQNGDHRDDRMAHVKRTA
ncbi:MAG: hypothetical protein H7222_01895 [Methylotenera sp.]|nr:hypothetical protein [Oligoflexia bacterium]